jgi:hypothetical protein
MAAETQPPGALAERERVLRVLRQEAPRLRALGITHLSASMARGEAGPESDVDLLIETESAASSGCSICSTCARSWGSAAIARRRLRAPAW